MQRIAERLLQEHYNAASRAMKEWASAIDSRVDLDALQRAAGEAYQSYQESIRTMREVIQALTFDVGDDVSNFNKWREFDAEYLAGLNTLCGHPELPTLKTLVTSHMWPAMGKRNFADWKPVQPGEPPGGTLDSAEVIDALIDYREALLEMINRVMLHDDVKAGLIAMSAKRTTQLDQSQRRSRKLVLARENVLRRMAAQANPATPTGSALSKVVAALGNLKAAPHWRDDREIEATAKIHQSIDGTVSAIHAAKAS